MSVSEASSVIGLSPARMQHQKEYLKHTTKTQKEKPVYHRWLELSRRELNPGLKRDKLAY